MGSRTIFGFFAPSHFTSRPACLARSSYRSAPPTSLLTLDILRGFRILSANAAFEGLKARASRERRGRRLGKWRLGEDFRSMEEALRASLPCLLGWEIASGCAKARCDIVYPPPLHHRNLPSSPADTSCPPPMPAAAPPSPSSAGGPVSGAHASDQTSPV